MLLTADDGLLCCGQLFCPLTLDKLLPPTRRNLLGRVSFSGETTAPGDESDLTWAELSEKMRQERLEHDRLRKQDADVIRDLRMSEDLMIQLLDLRAQSFNTERRRLIDELNSVRLLLYTDYEVRCLLLITLRAKLSGTVYCYRSCL